MRIKEILRQHRRDFTAVYECEHCGVTAQGYGYDDTNFHENVIPTRECPSCGRTTAEDYVPRPTKYPDGMTV